MSDTKLRPEDLTVEERAWCDRMAAALCSSGNYTAEGAIDEAVNFGLKKRRALFGQPKGESESCPNCGETTSRTHSRYAGPGPDKWTCQPAPPEPAAPVNGSTPVGEYDPDMKPAAPEMPEAVRDKMREEALDAALNRNFRGQAGLLFVEGYCAAVRQQAAQGRKMALPKVREYFDQLCKLPQYHNEQGRDFLEGIYAELDAAEGKSERRVR